MPIDNSKYTILLIISSFEEPDKVVALLQDARFKVLQAANEQEAIRIAGEHLPDLILLDIDKSARTETSIIRELKSNRATRLIPVLFIASIANESYIPECLSYDNVDFITKPYRPQELMIRIQHQLLLLRAQRTIRRQNEKLRQTLEARDKLYSVIAHDLRAPIGTIKMINSSIENQRSKIKDPGIRKLFEMINGTTEEAFNLLENLLRWTRNQNGKTKVYASTFNITLAIRQVTSLFASIACAKEIKIYNHSEANVYVYADEDMIKTALRNLLSNAVKFTYPGGRIDIDATPTATGALVSIKDNGKGIANDIQPKLLKSNEYTTSYGTRNEKGSGLGLVLTNDFIKMNKGKFWFDSQEGVGTTFFFTLPLHSSEHHAPADNR